MTITKSHIETLLFIFLFLSFIFSFYILLFSFFSLLCEFAWHSLPWYLVPDCREVDNCNYCRSKLIHNPIARSSFYFLMHMNLLLLLSYNYSKSRKLFKTFNQMNKRPIFWLFSDSGHFPIQTSLSCHNIKYVTLFFFLINFLVLVTDVAEA